MGSAADRMALYKCALCDVRRAGRRRSGSPRLPAARGAAINPRMLLIRPASHQDVVAIARLHLASWRAAQSALSAQDRLGPDAEVDLRASWEERRNDPRDLILVAENERILGFAAVRIEDDALIDSIHIDPAWRAAGVAAGLLRGVASQLLERGERSAHLWIAENDADALSFYEGLGGEAGETETRDTPYGRRTNRRIEFADLNALLKTGGAG